jgi:hypothetical protein
MNRIANRNDSHQPRERTMRGGALSRLLAAFRLRQIVSTNHDEVSEGTAKRAFNDQRDIGREKHVMLLRRAVEELFAPSYLARRGFDVRDAAKHNDLVTHAVDVVLVRWDQYAAATNVVPDLSGSIGEQIGVATGFAIELPLRLAAYEARYGYLHPCLAEVPDWLAGPNLQRWWASVERRARVEIKPSRFYTAAYELAAHTVRDLRDGQALPKEGTVRVLARRLADHSIRDRVEDRDADAAELEFELRVATAVAEWRGLVERLFAPGAHDIVAMLFRALREVLNACSHGVAEELLKSGTDAASWPRVERAMRAILGRTVVDMWREMRIEADRLEAALAANPKETWRAAAELFGRFAAQLRDHDRRPGADGPEKRTAECFEIRRDMALVVGTNGAHPAPVARDQLPLEIQADGLVLETFDPSATLPAPDKEKRLREAVRICDSSSFVHRTLADHLHRVGKGEEASVHYHRSIELNPANEEGRGSFATHLMLRGDFAAVLALTEVHSCSVITRAPRAYALLMAGEPVAAAALARENLIDNPGHVFTLRTLAACARVAGDSRKAREYDQKADLFERGVRPTGA